MHSRSMMLRLATLAAILPALPGAARSADGDAQAGRTAFNRRCGACHATAPGQNKVGPSLHGVAGRPSGQVPGFTYSPAMRSANRTWDEAALNAYLEDPKAFVPGNRMIMPGIREEAERQNIIAYLATLR